MSDSLEDKQYIPLTRTERAELKAAAQQRNMTPAVLGRALLLMGQKRLGEKAVEAAVEAERIAAEERVIRTARKAAATRWGNTEKGAGSGEE